MTLPCQHSFHKSCFDDWFSKNQGKCPLCTGNEQVDDQLLQNLDSMVKRHLGDQALDTLQRSTSLNFEGALFSQADGETADRKFIEWKPVEKEGQLLYWQ